MDSANLAAQSKQDPEHVDMRVPGFQNRKPTEQYIVGSAALAGVILIPSLPLAAYRLIMG
jgi:hypothetical protein